MAYVSPMRTSEPQPNPPKAVRPARPRKQARTGAPKLQLTLRLDVGGQATLGPGKVRLLELIGETGSISAAARVMGMSYRRGWVLVESLNAAFTGPLVSARPGGTGGGGAALLPLGAEVVRLYRTLEQHAADTGAAELERLQAVLAPPPS